jgi:hypothetical protein
MFSVCFVNNSFFIIKNFPIVSASFDSYMIANHCYSIIGITIKIAFRIIIVLVPLAFVLYDVQHRYRPASRDLKRVSSTSLSPIYSHFSETLSGLTTVRAMKSVGRFEQECLDKVEANQKAQFASVAAAQWLELRLQVII